MTYRLMVLQHMRSWILDREKQNKKKLYNWQLLITFIGIFVSLVLALGLFFISQPLALSALIPMGLSFLLPLFVRYIPFTNEKHILAETTKRFERAIIQTVDEMNAGIRWVSFDGPVLGERLPITVLTYTGSQAQIFLRSDGSKLDFVFPDNTPVAPGQSI